MPTDSQSTLNPSADLARFIDSITPTDLPVEAIENAATCIIDTIGVTIAGANTDAGIIAATAMADTTSTGSCTLIGHDRTAPLPTTCFINGTAAHALDFDDFSYAYPAHPSAVIATVALATAEANDLTGRDVLEAYVIGYETYYYFAKVIGDEHYEIGWHATSTIGTFSAAATASYLLGLSSTEAQQALNIAVSHPAGLRCNFGTMCKPMHVGIAARAGVTAALLASEGFTANPTAITSEHGFFDVYAGPDVSLDSRPSLGDTWGIIDVGVGTKKYPSSGPTHSGIAAVAAILADNILEPEEISTITVTVAPFARDVLQEDFPSSGLEAKFSLPYCLATMIHHGSVGLDSFTQQAITNQSVTSLADRVTVTIDDSLPYNSHKSIVTIETTAGDRYTKSVDHPPGTKGNPLSSAELREKFTECVEWGNLSIDALTLYQKVTEIKSRPISELTPLFSQKT